MVSPEFLTASNADVAIAPLAESEACSATGEQDGFPRGYVYGIASGRADSGGQGRPIAQYGHALRGRVRST